MSAVNPIKEARDRIEKRLESQTVKTFGLADDLRAILRCIDELNERTETTAAIILRWHYGGQNVTPSQWAKLADMGEEAALVHRVANHNATCTCGDCMKYSMDVLRAMSESGI